MQFLRNIYVWLTRRPAYMMLTASDAALGAEKPERFTRAWMGVMLLSLGWGALACATWAGAHALFHLEMGNTTSSIPLLPALATTTVLCLWSHRRALLATSRKLLPVETMNADWTPALVLAVLVATVMAIFSAFTGGESGREPYLPLPDWAQNVRPYWRHYRVLLLAPLWGGWAMMIAPKFRRFSPTAGDATTQFARGCGPLCAAACMLVPLLGSIFYFQFLWWWWQAIICSLTIVSVPLWAQIAGRRGGLDRSGMLATSLLTQLVFLLTYVAALKHGQVFY